MTVSSSIGPISGIDYGKLITGLTSIEQQPIDDITTRLDALDKQNTALLGLSTLLTGLKVSAANFASSAIFHAATATPGNPAIATAVAGIGAPTGNYSFNVQRLASASQQVSQGFASSSNPLNVTGTINLQLGGGELDDVAKLSELNGGAGVARGTIRISDRSGASTLVDLSHAVDINDVVDAINSTTGVNVTAKIDSDHLVLTDNSGGTGTLTVSNAGGATTASDLGLTTAAAGSVITGANLTSLNSATSLDSLNDGLGVRISTLPDFTIAGASGAAGAVSVTLAGAKTLGDVISKINAAGQPGGFSAAISSDGRGITLSDSGGGPITVAAINGSLAASDLGIAATSTGPTLTGDRIASALQGPLLKNLNGGWQGQPGETAPTFGTITINAQTIDLSGARTLTDAIATINTNSQGVTAALNNAGTGLTLTSNSASFTVADGTGNIASFLKINGTSTAGASGSQINSGDLRLRYISDNTQLSTLNGGAGVQAGSIRITAPQLVGGQPTALTIDLSGAGSIGDVINRINSTGLAVTARVNDTGDGILLTQTAGAAPAKIEDVNGGTTAKDLGIAGIFSGNQLNGSFQKSISIVATDKLSDIAKKINDASPGVVASIINDGTGATPFRLNLVSRNSGVAGRLVFDGSAAGLTTTSLVNGQDAALIFGGNANGTGGLLSTSSSNTITSLVPGLALTLNGVGSTTISVNRDDGKISDTVQGFVDSYNKVIDNIATVTNFDQNDPTQNGVLFGDSTVQQVQDALGLFVGNVYSGVGPLNSLASVGITIGQDGKLTLDTDKLSSVLATNPDDVRSLFTTNLKAITGDITTNPPIAPSPAVKGIGATLSDLLDRYTDAQTGILFQSSDAITSQEQELKDRQSSLTDLVTAKKNRLVQQFAQLEVTIAQLQQQGTALSSLKSASTTSS